MKIFDKAIFFREKERLHFPTSIKKIKVPITEFDKAFFNEVNQENYH